MGHPVYSPSEIASLRADSEDYDWAWEDDHNHDALATPTDARHEYAANAGAVRPQDAWIITPWDTWEANPFYVGPKVRHPEDDYENDTDDVVPLDADIPW
jgi:hypothetical protein